MTAGILIFPGVEELDFVGPWEVLAATERISPPGCTVFSIAESESSVRAAHGLPVLPDFAFESAPAADLVVIPGGPGVRDLLNREPWHEFLRSRAAEGAVLASVCTGSLLLASAGLLVGRRAATHHLAREDLAGYAGVTVVEDRWVDEGPIVTSGGVASGMDMALHLVERFFSAEVAGQVRTRLELR